MFEIMNKVKIYVLLGMFSISLAIAGAMNIHTLLKEQFYFYNSASVHSIEIDSISLISSDPVYGIHSVIGYGYLDFNDNYLAVDMTNGVNINSFSRGEAYAFIGQTHEIFVNSKFNLARLKNKEISEINARNRKNMLIYMVCFFPLIAVIYFWVTKLLAQKNT